MILCLVTDRRRLPGGSAAAVLDLARAAIAAGVDLIQIRERDLDARPLAALVEAAVRAADGTPTRVVVNDRLDVALAAGAHGVHLRGDSVPAKDARRLAGPSFLIGRSVHTVDEAASATDVDYLIAGTVFPSASKPGARTLLGTDGLRAIVNAVKVPVLAIGGVTIDRLPEVAAAGAAGAAAIGLFAGRGASLHTIAADARARFDTRKTHP